MRLILHHVEQCWNKYAKAMSLSYLDRLEIGRLNPGLGVATTRYRYTVSFSFVLQPILTLRTPSLT